MGDEKKIAALRSDSTSTARSAPMVAMNQPLNYSTWGDQAKTAEQQGWYPETDFKGQVTYRSKYDLFNDVILPNQAKRGHVAVIGYPNNKMDIVIRDADGNVVQNIMQKVSPQDVQKYITKQGSLVDVRAQSIKNGTNIDKPDAAGNFVSVYR